MAKKRRKNPFGDLAHFNPFSSRGRAKSYRRNVADEDLRNLQQRAEIGDEDARETLERAYERVIQQPRPRTRKNTPKPEKTENLWGAIGKLVNKKKATTPYQQSIQQVQRQAAQAQRTQRTNRPVRAPRALPVVSENVCRPRTEHQFSDPCFDSIKEARAFLEFKVPEMTPEECAANAAKIQKAEQVVSKADRRNQKRKIKRSSPPANYRTPFSGQNVIRPATPTQTPQPKKEMTHYEELAGPEGEIHRFKLLYQDGKFKKRVRTKEEPPIGSVILDMTEGAKAWKRYSDKRRGIPLTPEMKRSYENSFLYKVRQFAAGKINYNQLIEKINSVKRSQKSKRPIFKKLRRKNRKNG